MITQGTTNTIGRVRQFHATIHYEEWQQRRWLRKRTRCYWWSEVVCGNAGTSYCVDNTLTGLKRQIIPALKFLLEDETSSIFVTHSYSTPEVAA